MAAELSADDRVAMQLRTSDAILAVQLRDCRVHLVPACTAVGRYMYAASNVKDETAPAPGRAPGDPAQPGDMTLHTATVGTFTADGSARPDGKTDACARATHAIVGFTAGAFELAATESHEGPLGGSATRKRSTKDGDFAICANAKASEPTPPAGCSAPVRLRLEPLRR